MPATKTRWVLDMRAKDRAAASWRVRTVTPRTSSPQKSLSITLARRSDAVRSSWLACSMALAYAARRALLQRGPNCSHHSRLTRHSGASSSGLHSDSSSGPTVLRKGTSTSWKHTPISPAAAGEAHEAVGARAMARALSVRLAKGGAEEALEPIGFGCWAMGDDKGVHGWKGYVRANFNAVTSRPAH